MNSCGLAGHAFSFTPAKMYDSEEPGEEHEDDDEREVVDVRGEDEEARLSVGTCMN